ncbi:hypothetical protein LT330_002640 [Penicillium expansum]|nr:hypothetical protein N7453_007157 [Penicillium expansum]KAK4862507.1 hypothetical protein LT330_002640 [Penicillium expansum]
MAPRLKKDNQPAKLVFESKVKKTRGPRAAPKKKFTENEVFFYQAIKNGGTKFDYAAIGNAIGRSKDATRMKMSRLLKEIGEFMEDQEDLVQKAQPKHEENPANAEDAENGSQDDKDGSQADDTPVDAIDTEDS